MKTQPGANPEPDEESVWEPQPVTVIGAYTSNYWRERTVKVKRHPIGFSKETT